jgi:hypothetical protein
MHKSASLQLAGRGSLRGLIFIDIIHLFRGVVLSTEVLVVPWAYS